MAEINMQRSPLSAVAAMTVVAWMPMSSARAQVKDQFFTFVGTYDFHRQFFRYDRKLELQGITDFTALGGSVSQRIPVAMDGFGRLRITYNELDPMTLLRLDSDGTLLPSVALGHNPVSVIVSRDNEA